MTLDPTQPQTGTPDVSNSLNNIILGRKSVWTRSQQLKHGRVIRTGHSATAFQFCDAGVIEAATQKIINRKRPHAADS